MDAKPIRCPRCGQLTTYSSQNNFRPFCSERCQMIDLGQWASEKHVIVETETDLSESEVNQNSEEDVSE